MGFFFRKAVGYGPVRFNFSKSGVGASIGVKGFRVTAPARGTTYVTVGAMAFITGSHSQSDRVQSLAHRIWSHHHRQNCQTPPAQFRRLTCTSWWNAQARTLLRN